MAYVRSRHFHARRPVPKEYLHSAELRDIMQFGSSSTAVRVLDTHARSHMHACELGHRLCRTLVP